MPTHRCLVAQVGARSRCFDLPPQPRDDTSARSIKQEAIDSIDSRSYSEDSLWDDYFYFNDIRVFHGSGAGPRTWPVTTIRRQTIRLPRPVWSEDVDIDEFPWSEREREIADLPRRHPVIPAMDDDDRTTTWIRRSTIMEPN